ncbi:MAG: type III pantothenate kinase [Candidatus Marinimicrobia bacterium]|nr:type III pantothenate kinase [Candidatus Neomarinimicrobiota bacterium]
MFLAIDIGNTNTVIGVYHEKELINNWRLASKNARTVDEYWIVTKLFCDNAGIDVSKIDGAIMGSVVPDLTQNYQQMVSQYFHRESIVVNDKINLGFALKVEVPSSVGADRICNVAAARVQYPLPAVVVDLGTATTFDVIDEGGDYIGGAISPGIYTASSELTRKAAKLSKIDLKNPLHYIGKTTEEHLLTGIFTGHIAMIEGLISRMQQEYGKELTVIATGGLSQEIADHCSLIRVADKNLTLEGLRILYEFNTEQ